MTMNDYEWVLGYTNAPTSLEASLTYYLNIEEWNTHEQTM
jgi:hypothetical protein